jgi:hypothetical protein
MKRKLALATAACTLAVPAIALGQTFAGIYEGHIEGASDTSVKLKFNGANQPDGSTDTRVRAFAVHNLSVECSDGVTAVLDHAKLKGNIRVGDGKSFRIKDDNDETVFKVSGRIGVNKAFGKFRLTGEITGTDNVVRDCDTGSLAWVARP